MNGQLMHRPNPSAIVDLDTDAPSSSDTGAVRRHAGSVDAPFDGVDEVRLAVVALDGRQRAPLMPGS